MVGYLNKVSPHAPTMRALKAAIDSSKGIPAVAPESARPTITSYPESQSDSALSVSYALTYNTNRDKVYSGGGKLVAYSGGGLKGATVNTGANVGANAFQESVFHALDCASPVSEFTVWRQNTTKALVMFRDSPAEPWRLAHEGLIALDATEAVACIKLAFPTPKPTRQIWIGLAFSNGDTGTAAVLTRIRVQPGYATSAPAAPIFPLKAILLGESFIQSAFYNLPWFLQHLLNVEITASGIGGTGEVATNGGTQPALSTRAADDAVLLDYDFYIVAMGVNDGGQSGIAAAVKASNAALRATGAAKPILRITPWNANAPGPLSAPLTIVRDTIIAAQRGVLGVNTSDPSSIVYPTSDGLHPTRPDGALDLANWYFNDLRAIAAQY